MENFEKIAQIVFDDETDAPATNWSAALLRSEHGVLKPLLANAITVLSNASPFAGMIKLDEFAARIMLLEHLHGITRRKFGHRVLGQTPMISEQRSGSSVRELQ